GAGRRRRRLRCLDEEGAAGHQLRARAEEAAAGERADRGPGARAPRVGRHRAGGGGGREGLSGLRKRRRVPRSAPPGKGRKIVGSGGTIAANGSAVACKRSALRPGAVGLRGGHAGRDGLTAPWSMSSFRTVAEERRRCCCTGEPRWSRETSLRRLPGSA